MNSVEVKRRLWVQYARGGALSNAEVWACSQESVIYNPVWRNFTNSNVLVKIIDLFLKVVDSFFFFVLLCVFGGKEKNKLKIELCG